MDDEGEKSESKVPYVNEGGVCVGLHFRGQAYVQVEPHTLTVTRERALLLIRGLQTFVREDAIQSGVDPYKVFASEFFDVPPESVTSAMRWIAKKISFGRSIGRLAKTAGEIRDEMVDSLRELLRSAYEDRRGQYAGDGRGRWCDACGETRVTQVDRSTCLDCLSKQEKADGK
jgi:hypothetical protein